MHGIEIPEVFALNPGDSRVPDGINADTCVTVMYRDGWVTTSTYYDPIYWQIRSGSHSDLDIIAYKIEQETAALEDCGVNS